MRQLYLIIATILCMGVSTNEVYSQSIAVKSNILYDMTGTLNLGGEIKCDNHHSFQLNVNYNPWELGENKKMKQILIQPEYRIWFDEVFTGSFIGIQAHYGQYNFGGTTPFTTVKNNRYQGDLIGVGFAYGHQWILSTFWSLEAGLSVGYAHLSYKKYGPAKGDAMLDKAHKNYWGPTQVSLSLIYFIR